MKITKTLPFFFLVSLWLLCGLMACHEHEVIVLSNRTLLAGDDEFGKTWQIRDIDIELGNLTPHPCVTDNYITYYPNGNYEVNEGLSKCNPDDPVGATGVWSFNEFESQIFINFGDSTQVWEIHSLDKENHRISAFFIEGERTYNLVTGF